MSATESTDRAPDRFRLSVATDGDRPVLELFGELDLGSAPALEHELDGLAGHGDTVVLDLSALAFMDSTGLRTILAGEERLRAHQTRLVLVRGPRAVDRVFRITGTAEHLEFLD